MKSYIFLAFSTWWFVFSPLFAQAQSENYTWMVWEQRKVDRNLCETKNLCSPQRKYITRLVEQPTEQKAREMLGAIAQLAKLRGQPVEHPEAPQMCRNTEAGKILGFDPELWDMSDKLAALKDLEGVYFSVRTMKGPKSYKGQFGLDIQKDMEARFANAGLSVLSEEQMEETAGKPHLNIYFSNTNPKTGCTYSVFASLTQTMLLTRNHTTKLKVGTWGFSGGPSKDHPNGTEYDAVMRVVDKFLEDYKRANILRN